MAKNQTLSLRVQWLGDRLRKARLAAGYTLEEAAEYLRMRHSTLSRFETGAYRARPSYIKDLIDFYGISDVRERDVLLQLNEDAWRKDWWDGAFCDLDKEFIDYTWLEARAERICVFEPLLIHGLLQTECYATALTLDGLGRDTSKTLLDRMVEVRMARQSILGKPSPVELSVVMEEAPLHRNIGGNKVHTEQLEHLITIAAQPNIDIRILPRGGWHPGLDGPFSFIDMPDPYPDVAYVENLAGRMFLEDDEKVDRYRHAFDGLHGSSLSSRESVNFIRNILRGAK